MSNVKIFIVCVLFSVPLQIVKGQDRIITVQQDTVHCRIVSVTSNHIHYEQMEGRYAVGKFIPIEQVSTYFRSPQSSAPVSYKHGYRQIQIPTYRWQAGVHFGRASFLSSTANDERSMIDMGIPKSQAKDYNRQLKHGWSINGDIHYMFTDFFGLGAKYSFFTSSVQKDMTINPYGLFNYNNIPEFFSIGMREIQYIHHAGPSVIFRQRLSEKIKLYLAETLSIGYVHYRNEGRFDPNKYTFVYQNMYGASVPIYNLLTEANTWGANVGLSAEYFPVSRLSVGVSAGFSYARLTKVDISTKETTQTVELEKIDYVSLARLDYSICVRFHF